MTAFRTSRPIEPRPREPARDLSRLSALTEERPAVDEPGPGADDTQGEGTTDDVADVVARMRARAASSASVAYTAAYGHPLEHRPFEEGASARRWRIGRRAGLGALAGVVVLVGAVLAVTGLRAQEALQPLASLEPAEAPILPAAGLPGSVDDTDESAEPGLTGAVGAADLDAGVVVVHVAGAVHDPGVYTLTASARVAEAIEAAGGATKKADLDAVNLARVVEDGEQIRVPREGEEVPAGSPAPGGGDAGAGGGLIDLNTADAAALDGLPGIGPVLAARIIAWRDEHGRFSAVAELAEVSGIGPRLLSGLSELVRV